MDQDRLRAYQLATDFVLGSILSSGGSAAYYSKLYQPFGFWSGAYPETTGYLIPTLFDAGKSKEAIALADWIIELQYEDGGLPGGLMKNGKKEERSIFNTAQMIIGLHRAANETSEERFSKAALAAGIWLKKVQNEDGSWSKYHYKKGYFPSYYTRVAWPMLLSAEFEMGDSIKNAAIKTFELIQLKKLDNQFIKDSAFESGQAAFLHTIAYTIRGFIEAGIILNRKDFFKTGYNLSYKLFRKYELKKYLAGAYHEDFSEVKWYRCLTGEAQMCIIWLLIADHKDDPRFVNVASKVLDDLCKVQPTSSFLKKKGGLPGSKPYYGRYIAFRQPNWATKFFMDALYLEDQAYKKLEQMS